MIKVSERVYAETKYLGCNVGVIVTAQGPILIDTPTLPQDALDLRVQVAKLTPRHIARLIYTHEHFDHVIGSAYLTKKGIVGHQATVSEIEYLKTNLAAEITHFFPDLYRQYQDVFDSVKLISPDITFVGEMRLYAGDLTLELSHIGGHSPASIMVCVKEDRVLFCGDIVDVGMPFVTPYSRFDEWIAALRRIEAMDVDKIVPGHGEICGKETVRATRIYFETMRDRVQAMLKQDASKEEVVTKINVDDVLPVPFSEALKPQVQSTINMMYDEIAAETE